MYATLVIIAVTCIVSFMAFKDERLMARLIFWPPAISRARQYDRFITSGLIHADGTHLLFNMVTLFFFGRAMEGFYAQYMGAFGFPLFYASALVVSSLPTYLKHRNDANYRSLGASGAVSAVLFGFILLQPWAVIYVYFLPVPAIVYAIAYTAYTVYMDRRGGDNINHSAHLAGAIYGVLFTLAMEPRVFGLFLGQLLNPSFGR